MKPFGAFAAVITKFVVLPTLRVSSAACRVVMSPVVCMTASAYLLLKAWMMRREALFAARVRLLDQLSDDMLKKYIPLFAPAWAKYPGYNPVDWINHVIEFVWEDVNEYMYEWMAGLVERALEHSAPAVVKTLRVVQFDLGSRPFKITGVKSVAKHSSSQDFLEFECELMWDAEPHVVIQLVPTALFHVACGPAVNLTVSPSVFVACRSAQMCARVRLRLFGVTATMPAVQSLDMAFMQQPYFSFGISAGTNAVSLINLPALGALLSAEASWSAGDYVLPQYITLYSATQRTTNPESTQEAAENPGDTAQVPESRAEGAGQAQQEPKVVEFLMPRPLGVLQVDIVELKLSRSVQSGGTLKDGPYPFVVLWVDQGGGAMKRQQQGCRRCMQALCAISLWEAAV